MIPRYSLPEMSLLCDSKTRFDIWLEIERYACEAQEQLGSIPPGVARALASRGKFEIERIQELEQELKLIEEKDSELRTYATLAPLSDDVKAKGVGGSTIEDSSTEDLDGSSIMLLKDRVDSLAFAVDIQKDSYNTIFNKIKSNEKMFRHIPSIAPVKGYIGSRYGYRTDPIDGKRRMHSGLDFPVNLNTDVVATGDGLSLIHI